MGFEELVKTISPTLKRITYKLNGHFSFFNDEDLYQEALVHLWLDFKDGKLQDKTESYILQGCYFHLKNHLRKARDKACIISMDALVDAEGLDLEEILCLEDPRASFEELDNKMLSDRIRDSKLTSREKEILFLCMEGMTVREMGRRLGISHVMVVKLMAKIRGRIKQLVTKV